MSMSSIGKHHRGGGKLGPACGDVHLELDQACLEIVSNVNETFTFKAQSLECYNCDLWTIGTQFKNGSFIKVNTTYGTRWELSRNDENDDLICNHSHYTFGQYGIYNLNVHDQNCSLEVIQDPSNPYFAILWAFFILGSLQISWIAGKSLYKNKIRPYLISRSIHQGSGLLGDDEEATEETETEHERSKRKRRVKSLDAFRGLAIVIMIFVNYGGGGYSFFAHAKWNGITVADLVFPWFMWIMGVSMAISIQSQLRNSMTRKRIAFNIAKRSLILFSLGLIINSIGGNNDLSNFRIPGVLQRFGFCYLIVGLIQVVFASRDLPSVSPSEANLPFWWSFRDVKICLLQWVVMLGILLIHASLTFLLPVPGCPTGYLGPGGAQENYIYANCTGGSASYIDAQIFGLKHMYTHPSSMRIYDSKVPFDPEGFLGSLSSAFLVFLGVQCGYTLLTFSEWQPRIRRWLLWGFVLGVIAGGLCGFSKEEGVVPLNKNLWSLSFSLALGSFAFILLSVMYLLIDVWKIWEGTPILYAGMNPIVLYVGHEICEELIPFSWQPFTQTHFELLLMNLWGTGLWVLFAYKLYKKGIFISI